MPWGHCPPPPGQWAVRCYLIRWSVPQLWRLPFLNLDLESKVLLGLTSGRTLEPTQPHSSTGLFSTLLFCPTISLQCSPKLHHLTNPISGKFRCNLKLSNIWKGSKYQPCLGTGILRKIIPFLQQVALLQ